MPETEATEPELIVNGGDYDATELIRSIRAELEAEERRAGAAPPAPARAGLPAALHDDLALLNLRCRIDTRAVPDSDRPGLGPLLTTLKKLLRPWLAWFVVPLVDRVSDFNVQVVGFLYRLADHLDRQAKEDLPARVARLERSRLATVPPPPPGDAKPVDAVRYYETFIAPRDAALAALAPHLAGVKTLIVCGAGKGELATALPGISCALYETDPGFSAANPAVQSVDDYVPLLGRLELAGAGLVIDDALARWGAVRLQAAFDLVGARAPAGTPVWYLAPQPGAYPLLHPEHAVPAELAVFLMRAAGLTAVTVLAPVPGTNQYLIRGEAA